MVQRHNAAAAYMSNGDSLALLLGNGQGGLPSVESGISSGNSSTSNGSNEQLAITQLSPPIHNMFTAQHANHQVYAQNCIKPEPPFEVLFLSETIPSKKHIHNLD